MTGYEVNRLWWEGQHSTPHFIDIQYVDESPDRCCRLPAHTALLFCYFNNLTYFHTYLDQYEVVTLPSQHRDQLWRILCNSGELAGAGQLRHSDRSHRRGTALRA